MLYLVEPVRHKVAIKPDPVCAGGLAHEHELLEVFKVGRVHDDVLDHGLHDVPPVEDVVACLF